MPRISCCLKLRYSRPRLRTPKLRKLPRIRTHFFSETGYPAECTIQVGYQIQSTDPLHHARSASVDSRERSAAEPAVGGYGKIPSTQRCSVCTSAETMRGTDMHEIHIPATCSPPLYIFLRLFRLLFWATNTGAQCASFGA